MFHTNWFGREYHLTLNRKGNLTSHPGNESKCKRVHYNRRGEKI